MTKPLTFGSTFAGIGGFDLAFARVGMQCLWQIEQNKQCQKVLAKHWPNVERVDDVQDIERIKQLKPVDVISGGFPCQDLSVAGKRKGLAGERSGLWFDLHSILRFFEPRWFVGENVPGLLSSNGGWDFAVLLGGLTRRIPTVPKDGWRSSGFVYGSWYSVAWRVLDARYFGLAQQRARVFIVASLGNGSCCEILFDRESLRGDSASSVQAGPEIAATIRSRSANRGVNAPGRGGEDDLNLVEVAGCLQERDARGSDSNTKPGHLLVSRLPDDVAGALQSHSERHGPRDDNPTGGESRHLVAMPLKASGGKGTSLCEDHETYVAVVRTDNAATDVVVTHALTGEGHDASEDGSQRGIPLVAETLTQTLGRQQCSNNPSTGLIVAQCHGSNVGEMGTLRAGGGDVSNGVPFVFEKRVARNGRDEPEDIVPPLKSATGSTGKGDGAALIAFDNHTITSPGNKSNPQVGDPCHALHARSDQTTIAFAAEQGAPNADAESGVAYSLDAGRGIQGVMRSGVRRLTPTECCALQGFPRDWFDGTSLSDSAMYRTLGNAVAVPVVGWIGKRIVEVDAKWNCQRAELLAVELVEEMRPYCERIEIAGSIRRQKPDVKDIEIVVIPKWEQEPDPANLFGEPVDVNRLHQWAMRQTRVVWIKPGAKEVEAWHVSPVGKYWRGLIGVADDNGPVETIKLDLFITRSESWGVIFAIRTGSAEFSEALVTHVKNHTVYRVQGGSLTYGEKELACPDERTLFGYAGLAWLPPKLRMTRADLKPMGDCGGGGGCKHTHAEHAAFDSGVAAGESGRAEDTNPYADERRYDWLAGYSVGCSNREVENAR